VRLRNLITDLFDNGLACSRWAPGAGAHFPRLALLAGTNACKAAALWRVVDERRRRRRRQARGRAIVCKVVEAAASSAKNNSSGSSGKNNNNNDDDDNNNNKDELESIRSKVGPRRAHSSSRIAFKRSASSSSEFLTFCASKPAAANQVGKQHEP
jgi:hypothetical protein